jgi:hypothetical protein
MPMKTRCGKRREISPTLPVFVMGLLLEALAVPPSCSRLMTAVSETVAQTWRLNSATLMSAPTGLFSVLNSLPRMSWYHSEP